MSAKVLPFARPANFFEKPRPTQLSWFPDDAFLFMGTGVLLDKIRNHVEVSLESMKFLQNLSGEVTWQEICIIQQDTEFAVDTAMGFEEVCLLAQANGFCYANPFSVLCWALFSYRLDISSNPFFEGKEINIGMFPEKGHYLAFENRGPRFNPRLSLQTVCDNRKHGRNSHWIFATMSKR